MTLPDYDFPDLNARLRGMCMAAAWLTSLFGGLILLGWFVGPRISSFFAEGFPLLLSVSFFLAGLGFFAFAYQRSYLTRILGAVIFATGLLTVLLGALDSLPFISTLSSYETSYGLDPDTLRWIRLTGGVSAILLGLWFFRFPTLTRISSKITLTVILGSLIFSVGIFSMAQQYLWEPLLGGAGYYFSFSIVALGQTLLGALLLSISGRYHIALFATSLWSWLLMPIGIILLMGTLVMANFMKQQQQNRILVGMQAAGAQLEAVLNTFLNERISFTRRLARRFEADGDFSGLSASMQESIRMFVTGHPDFARIRWIYLDGRNVWTATFSELAQSPDGPDASLIYFSKRLGDSPTQAPSEVTILQTFKGFSLMAPVRRNQKIVSVLICDFDAGRFLATLPEAVLPSGYKVRIKDKLGNELYPVEATVHTNAPRFNSDPYQISLQGLYFNLEMTPLLQTFSYQVVLLPWLMLFAGCAISLLLMWAYYLAQTAQFARMELEHTNATLIDEVRRRSLVEHQLRKTHDELENKISERTEQLTHSNQELEQFAFIASHDLQEPVRKVANYLDLLMIHSKGDLNADAQRDVDRIFKAVSQMKSLLSELMALLRVRHDNAPFEQVNLEEEVHNVLSGLDNTAGIDIKVDPLPAVMGNRLRLRQLFHNLISNAIKFRSKEAPMIHISAHQENENWIISVRDNGIGINPEHRARIFEIFQRLNPRGYPGTGMGLAICKRIIESHGGKIWVESASGYGSTFKFNLPVLKEVGIQNHDEITVG